MSYNSPVFSHDDYENLLIIQCNTGELYGDLIACARYRIDDQREKVQHLGHAPTHVLFIINVHRFGDARERCNSFVGYQSGYWTSLHIDNIREDSLTLNDVKNEPMNKLFYSLPFSCSFENSDTDEVESVYCTLIFIIL